MRAALLIFILVPIIEMWVLIEIGSQIGGLMTILLVLVTAIVGVSLIRKQGTQTLLRAQEKMRQGTLPAVEVAEGVMLGVAGLCLIIPGFVTDALGALLLISAFRRVVAAVLMVKFIASRAKAQPFQQARYSEDHKNVIDGEFVKEDNDYIDKN